MFLKKIGFNGAEKIKLSINLEALAMIRDSEYFFSYFCTEIQGFDF